MATIIHPPPGGLDLQAAAARKFLDQKVRETIGKCHVPGLGAVLVTQAGERRIHSAQGRRKLGATGTQNEVQVHDQWFLGSISKPVTGTVIGILVQKGVGGITWATRLKDVFPEVTSLPGAWSAYFDVTVEQFMAHTSGMPGEPAMPNDQPPADAALLSDADVIQRRRNYLNGSVLDEPKFIPGENHLYSGGAIICAAMFEKRTGVRFDRLLKQHLYDALGMAHSGWGLSCSVGQLDGLYLHEWNDPALALAPMESAQVPQSNFGSRSVVGNYTMSVADMGRFIREHLRPDPQAMSLATRSGVQSHVVTSTSPFSRGGWHMSSPGSPGSSNISHNGDGGSMYADLMLRRSAGWGSAAFVHCNNRPGAPAVYDLQNTMDVMVQRWNSLFADTDGPMWEAAHPAPAVVYAGPEHLWMFARKHTGALVRQRLSLVGPPEAAVEFPGGVFTSGVAAAVSGNGQRIHVMARGTDDRIWRGWSTNGGSSWQGFSPIGTGTFDTGPAVAMSNDGNVVHVVAVGKNQRMYHARSTDGGVSWSNWAPIGNGVFTSQPALVCREDGKVVRAFARGTDYRIWNNASSDGDGWGAHWSPIGMGLFTSGPAAACNPSGSGVHVVARGLDRAYWRIVNATGAQWPAHWQQLSTSAFLAAPAIETTQQGQVVDVVGMREDWRAWHSRSTNGGGAWSTWAMTGDSCYV
jgi:CubicO group peptidase (beta-lactamase class C family)